jgi:hypothetical protein
MSACVDDAVSDMVVRSVWNCHECLCR